MKSMYSLIKNLSQLRIARISFTVESNKEYKDLLNKCVSVIKKNLSISINPSESFLVQFEG